MKTIKASDLHAESMKDDAYRVAYEELGGEFALAEALIAARTSARLSQRDVASRMGTTESAVSRLESGRVNTSTRTLRRYAEATGHRLRIVLEKI